MEEEYHKNTFNMSNFRDVNDLESEFVSIFLFVLVIGWFAGYIYQLCVVCYQDKCRKDKHRNLLEGSLLNKNIAMIVIKRRAPTATLYLRV